MPFLSFVTTIDGLDIHFIHVRLEKSQCSAGHYHARLARIRSLKN